MRHTNNTSKKGFTEGGHLNENEKDFTKEGKTLLYTKQGMMISNLDRKRIYFGEWNDVRKKIEKRWRRPSTST